MEYGGGNYTYELVDEWAELGKYRTSHVTSRICVAENDNVYVLGRGNSPLKIFSPDGVLQDAWEGDYFTGRPHGLTIGPGGNIYCVDDGSHVVHMFTPEGDLLMTLGNENEPSTTGYRDVSDIFERIASISHAAEPFHRPTDVTVFDSGDIVVSDGYGNARVHIFGPDGSLRRSWGDPGARPGEFRVPHAVQHDTMNRIWVADRENSRIQIFDSAGTFIEEWDDLIRPTDFAIGDDVVIVAELCKRISIFTIDGELLTRWGNETQSIDDPLFVSPHAVDVDSNGNIYVGQVVDTGKKENMNLSIQKFERVSNY